MPAIIKPTISSEIAKIYLSAIQAQTTNSYFILGKTTAWTDSDLGGGGIYNDANPPTPETSAAYEQETRKNIVSLQKAGISNTSLAIARYNWASGTTYDMYDTRYSSASPAPSGATNLSEARMFVLTDEFHLYKCIDNNNRAPSTVKPSGTTTSYLTLSDGYVWKYMKTVSVGERNQYLSPNFTPVSDIVSLGFYDGQIGFTINNGGSGYVSDNTVLTVSGDGSAADLQAVITSGSITNVVVNDPGTGYSSATIDITTPDSAKAQGINGAIDAVINQITTQNNQTNVQLAAVDREVSAISITNGGSGYTTATATIVGDGSNAALSPVLSGGAVTGFTITNRGSGYSVATVAVVGDGAGFQGDVIIAPTNGHGFSLVGDSFPTAIAAFVPGIDNPIQTMEVTTDYHQLGIVLDPIQYNVNDISNFVDKVTIPTATPCYLVTNPTVVASNYTAGEKLLDSSSNEFIAVAVEDGKMLVQALSSTEPVSGITLATQGVPPINVVIDSAGEITAPTYDRNSGSILYIDNRVPFSKGQDQIVNLRTFLEF